jgi:hypothetical protein
MNTINLLYIYYNAKQVLLLYPSCLYSLYFLLLNKAKPPLLVFLTLI